MTKRPSLARNPPISIRLSPVYEYGLSQIAEREGVPLGKLLRRVIEEWAQAYSRAEAAAVGDYIRTSKEGAELTAFADTALADMLITEERSAEQKRKTGSATRRTVTGGAARKRVTGGATRKTAAK